MSTDVNNKASFTTVNNNPSSTSPVDRGPSSPVIRPSAGTASDQSVSNRRSDFADYRGGSGGSGAGSVVAAGSSSFKSPKLECRGAGGGGGGTSAKKAQKTSLCSSAATSTAGKRRQKMTDVGTSTSTGRSQPSDSVRPTALVIISCCLT